MIIIQNLLPQRKFAILALPLLVGCQLTIWSAQSQPVVPQVEVTPQVEAAPPAQPELDNSAQAQIYYDEGVKYKALGWTEEARKSLKLAIETDPDGVGKRASIYLKAYIPQAPVTTEMVQLNILGYNQMESKDTETAIKTFKLCIERAPEFEWPYGNLSSVYREQGKLTEAKAVANQVLAINPNYMNGWLHLTRANIAAKDAKAARASLAKAAAIDESNDFIPELANQIDALDK